jgi:hypothetical protein
VLLLSGRRFVSQKSLILVVFLGNLNAEFAQMVLLGVARCA